MMRKGTMAKLSATQIGLYVQQMIANSTERSLSCWLRRLELHNISCTKRAAEPATTRAEQGYAIKIVTKKTKLVLSDLGTPLRILLSYKVANRLDAKEKIDATSPANFN